MTGRSAAPGSATSPAAAVARDERAVTMQTAVLRLHSYWSAHGCMMWRPYNSEVGAGTMNPATFLRVLGPEPWNVAYEEPSVRPADSRYGENPNRVQQHTQFQVILKPCPHNCQELLLGSLRALGVDITAHDVRFVEDNWESPALGAWGLGYEVWLDGCEIAQYTFFQQAGGFTVAPVALEITYGLERIMMALQGKTHFRDIAYAPGITYGEVFMQNEVEMSRYNLDEADVPRNRALFDAYESEASDMIERRLPVPAYNYVLRASHAFNVLDARGAIGVTERARYFHRMRALARQVAALWVERRDELGHPLLRGGDDGRGGVDGAADPAGAAAVSGDDTAAVSPASPTPPDRRRAVGASTPPTPSSEQRTVGAASGAAAGATHEDFLLEIGTEELPPTDVDAATEQLRHNMSALLDETRLSYAHDGLEVHATPRRLAVTVRGLEARQADRTVEVRGPPARVAYDPNDGTPTPAAEGFARKSGVSLASTERRSTPQGEYLFAVRREAGRDALDVLAERLVDGVLDAFHFGKSMRWNASGVHFSRPVRWLCAMLGARVVPLHFAGLDAGAVTRGLRTGADGESATRALAHARDYAGALDDELGVVRDADARRAAIARQADELARSAGGRVTDPGDEMLHEVAHLVEAPRAVMGAFDEQYLQLPAAVLTTVMREHQRYFPVAAADDDYGDGDASPRLLNRFITVANGTHLDDDAVRHGNEAVIRARYADAKFFYEADLAHTLDDLKPRLHELVFQERLGSMLDKTQRVEQLTPHIAQRMGLPATAQTTARTAAALCKADLATQMVIEFTSLAGAMGRHYAERQGYEPAVARAIYDACLPRSAGDALPSSGAGAAVAVADRIDSLVGLFAAGLVPRSTADPFALRRAALGVVQTLARAADAESEASAEACDDGHGAAVDIADLVRAAAPLQPLSVDDDTQRAVLDFVARRAEQWLRDERHARHDFVRAVLAYHGSTPARAVRALTHLEAAEADGRLARALAAYARPARLIKKGAANGSSGRSHGNGNDDDDDDGGRDGGGNALTVDPSLFVTEAERDLHAALERLDAADGTARVGASPVRDVATVVDALVAIQPQVDALLDGVYVMSEDARLRANRLALCARVAALPDGVVDLTQVHGY